MSHREHPAEPLTGSSKVPGVRIVPARADDKEILRQLLEFNAYEFSRYFDDAELNEHGRFGYRYLDLYWTEPERHPFLIRANDHIAGMVLVRADSPRNIAEFLIMPSHRRSGVGIEAARQVFRQFMGSWSIHQVPRNDAAVAFWRRAIPCDFDEVHDENGTTQRFTMPENSATA